MCHTDVCFRVHPPPKQTLVVSTVDVNTVRDIVLAVHTSMSYLNAGQHGLYFALLESFYMFLV